MKKTKAISHFGSAAKLAAALGISKSAVSLWGVDIPELRAYQLEKLTNGTLKAGGAGATKDTVSLV